MSSSSSNFRRSLGSGRFGLNRPSLDSMKTTVRPPSKATTSTTRTPPPSAAPAETDDDYDDYYDSEEEEEAILSKRYGEAMEDTAASRGKNKRSATDMATATTTTTSGEAAAGNNNNESADKDIADEYKNQEKKKKQRRRAVTTIRPEDLVSADGLSKLRHVIGPQFHTTTTTTSSSSSSSLHTGKPKYTQTPSSMAKYSRQLVAAYRRWMDELTGGIPLEEGMWKVQTLLSKGQVKQYVQEMRNQVRNEYVERTLGLEKAEQLLSQLDDYYHQQQQQLMTEESVEQEQQQQQFDEGAPEPPQHDDESNEDTAATTSLRVNNPYETSSSRLLARNVVAPVSGLTAVPEPAPITENPATETMETVSPLEETPVRTSLPARPSVRHVLDDSDDDDDEVEANFDDDIEGSSPEPTQSSKRRVLDDDDDDDDDDDIEMEFNSNKDNQEEADQDEDKSGDVPSATTGIVVEDESAKEMDFTSNEDKHEEAVLKDNEGRNQDEDKSGDVPTATTGIVDDGPAMDTSLNHTDEDVDSQNNELRIKKSEDCVKLLTSESSPIDSPTTEPTVSGEDGDKDDDDADHVPTQLEKDDVASPSQTEKTEISTEDNFNDFPLIQASEAPTLVGTQFSQDPMLFETNHYMNASPPTEESTIGDSPDASTTRPDSTINNLSQESETPTVLATQGMTQEWMTQNNDELK
ncbi:replication fork protection component [Nitzschia inconspicua]|uniref:Replication fork protection component n=1 Tax=Nitzschia inconspicua TaxID=303405 RepID=A0A9K3LBU5_9STRA|nr:replication fork protection component [Nitzschia inconspicua]